MQCGTNSSQKVPAGYAELMQHFRASIIKFRKAKNITPSKLVNMDHTMCRFDMPGTRTNNVRGSNTIRIKTTMAEKNGFTVALAATAAGEKLPAVIVFKERKGVLGERVRQKIHIPSNVHVQASTNGWMTVEEYHRWLVPVYRKEGDRHLLIVFSYKPHKSEDSVRVAKERCNSDVLIIPGGCTSIVQPMDKCINKPFKESMRGSWQTWMLQDRTLTKAGNLKQPTRQDAINWVSAAWDSIKQDTIIRSFLVCGISNDLDGTEDDLASSDIPDVDTNTEPSEEDCEVDVEEAEDGDDADDMDPFSETKDIQPALLRATTLYKRFIFACLYSFAYNYNYVGGRGSVVACIFFVQWWGGSIFACLYIVWEGLSSYVYYLCSRGRAQPIITPKNSGRTFEKLHDIRKYAHPDFLPEAQCNFGGCTIERVRYTIKYFGN